ncbi:MAG: succinate dehydrogenase, hydrophobic membrane anchor protein [Gammaproteobacteria bacterium]
MSLRSPLGKVLGAGSAKEGTGHWWSQRMTALALLPLTTWFVVALLGLDSLDYEIVRAFIGAPLNTVLIILLLISLLYHSSLGLQVVVEDYVHAHGLKVAALILINFVHIALAVGAICSVVIIAVGMQS